MQGQLIPLEVVEEVVGEGVVVTTIVGEEEEMGEEDGEEVEMVVEMVVNLEINLHPRAVRKYMQVHNWTKISLRTYGTPESTFPSTRTSR